MLLTVVAISSFILLSSAQIDPECTTAYDAVFNNINATACVYAYRAVFYGNDTEEQRMMVCNATQECNMMIETIISMCGYTIEYPTRVSQDLLCISNSNGDSCSFALTNLVNYENNIFETISTNCSFYCNQACWETLSTVNTTWGCCFGEIVRVLYENGTLTNTEATLYTNGYPGICGLEDFPLCDGSTLPPSVCSNATVNFFSANNTCSRAVQYLFAGNTDVLPYIFDATCATRFHYYVTACSDQFEDDELQNLAYVAVAISQQTNNNGTSCSEFVPTFLDSDDDDDENPCITDYLLRQCSTSCMQILTNVTAEFGCCFNAIVAGFNNISDDVSDQIESIILTTEIYSLCGIESGGYCNGITPTYTNAAQRCVSAGDAFFADGTCIDYYRTLGYYSSSNATALNSAATAICRSNACIRRMDSYLNYLRTCRVGGGQEDDDSDEDDDDDDDETDDSLDFVYLTGNTTCRAGNNNNSCYASIFTNPIYANVSAALDEGGVCYGSCPQECSQLLTTALNSVGCCLGEYGRALAGDDAVDLISRSCNIAQLTDRCSEIQPSGGGGGGGGTGGASTQKGFGVLIVLLGVTTIAFS